MIALLHHPEDRGACRDRESMEDAGLHVAMISVAPKFFKSNLMQMLLCDRVAVPGSADAAHTPTMQSLVNIAGMCKIPVHYAHDIVLDLQQKPAAAAAVPPAQQRTAAGNPLEQRQDNQLIPQ